jgi:hypothetical protein
MLPTLFAGSAQLNPTLPPFGLFVMASPIFLLESAVSPFENLGFLLDALEALI